MTDRQRPPGGDGDALLIAAGAAVIGAGLVTRGGAALACLVSGGSVSGGLSDWLTVTVRLLRGQEPGEAWGSLATGLPSPWIYWTATSVVALLALATTVLCWRMGRRLAGGGERTRFGQPTEAREARLDDIVPLVVPDIIPPKGRMLLGRVAGKRTVLATEDRVRHPLPKRHARRQGNRGSVALIGPTGSGKTALAASAIATWDGPVVAVSVKRDLYDTTAVARSTRGEIAMFDPGGATGMPTARWSPLEQLDSSSAALRAGRALAQAIPRSGVTNADYWAKHGEKLLGAFMAVAALSRMLRARGRDVPSVSIEQLATWVTTMAGHEEPSINELIREGLDKDCGREVRLLARHAASTFDGLAKQEHKVRSSVYTTASLALDPWLEPSVAHSASDSAHLFYSSDRRFSHRPKFIDLEWLMGGGDTQSNTLYLTASQPEFERLSPVLGGLLASIKDSIHEGDIAGTPLEKPLLIVIDEAGQLELGWLPGEVSTIAALGAFFVTCWQSLAQMQHRYTSLADAVLSGHRSKCFFAGIDDLATVRYVSNMLGHEHVRRRSWSKDRPRWFGGGVGRDSVSESEQREEFAPANALRQMRPGEAVLLHGTLPPIHLDAVRWWQERRLQAIVDGDGAGHPKAPKDLSTCPLTTDELGEDSGVLDERTFVAALTGLPAVRAATKPKEARADGEVVAPLARPVGRCEGCREELREGEAQERRRGTDIVLRCAPSCDERKALRQP